VLPDIRWAKGGKYQIATMIGSEVLQVITAEEMARMDGDHWTRMLRLREQMSSPNWRTDGKLPEHGKAYYLLGPSHCTACWRAGDHRRDRMGVVMSVNTHAPNTVKPGFWHAVWSCTDETDHWSRSAMRWRLLQTGSVTP